MPVTLPPDRLRLATRSSLTGSPFPAKTIGTVVVAVLATSIAAVFPATTATGRRINSATRAAPVHADLPPNDIDRYVFGFRCSQSPSDLAGMHERGVASARDVVRKSTTSIAKFRACDHAAAAPPITPRNSRRLMQLPTSGQDIRSFQTSTVTAATRYIETTRVWRPIATAPYIP